MAAPNGLHTYQDASRREDLLSIIADISPDETPILTMAKTKSAGQTLHEWADYYESAPSTVSKSKEGDDATFADLSAPSRKNNICQIITENFAVTETEMAVNTVTPQDAFNMQKGFASRRWKNKLEYSLLLSTKTSGSSGVEREMGGLLQFATADGKTTVRASGTSLSSTEFNDMIQDSYTVTDSAIVDLILCTAKTKRDISKFTASNTKEINADDKRIVDSITVYESDFGIHQIMKHRYMATNAIAGVKKANLAVAYLRRPKDVDLAQTGDSKKGQIVGEATLEVMSSRGLTFRSGYNLPL